MLRRAGPPSKKKCRPALECTPSPADSSWRRHAAGDSAAKLTPKRCGSKPRLQPWKPTRVSEERCSTSATTYHIALNCGEPYPSERTHFASLGNSRSSKLDKRPCNVSVLVTASSRPPGCSAKVWHADHTNRSHAPNSGATRNDSNRLPTVANAAARVCQAGSDKRIRPSALAPKKPPLGLHPDRFCAGSQFAGTSSWPGRVSAAFCREA